MAPGRTSQSDPLQIASVEIPGGTGVIGLTFCPGKKYHSIYGSNWDRDLCIDLQAIQAFGAKALVTLMESKELTDVSVPADTLAAEAGKHGLEWHHLPVRDVSIPDADFEDLWTYSGQRLRSLLARGDKIVIHCLGGVGRTGTVAARLLIEFGDQPQDAIRKIRKVRPSSIETQSQERYAAKCVPVPVAHAICSPQEGALACILGGAIGDAFGYEVEFSNISAIRKRFGAKGIQAPETHHGKLIVSDDTQMTLFTVEGLLKSLARGDSWKETCTPSIRAAYLDWYGTQRGHVPPIKPSESGWLAPQPVMRVPRAPGNTCLSALGAGGLGTLTKAINDSKGCGGVMRVAPIGLVGAKATTEEVFRLAAEAAALTHSHPSGYLSAGMMASIIHLVAQGSTLIAAVNESCGILSGYSGHEETLRSAKLALNLASEHAGNHVAMIEQIGGGWVGEEALAIGLYAVLSASSFVEVIAIATNHSGDSDSTASIAGQIWGAMKGLDGMPHDWIVGLDVLHPLLRMVRELTAQI
jgi:ADP-ribosylglycohydrolase/protein-tyrosine phosphatase